MTEPLKNDGGQSLLRRMISIPFVRNVAVVACGTTGAQAVAMLFSPVITRLYGPAAYGLLGTFMALVAVPAMMAALCYPLAIVLPGKTEDAAGIARLSGALALGMAVLLTLVLLVAGDVLIARLGADAVRPYVFLIPPAILFTAFLQIAQQWLIRAKLFDVLARAAVLQALLLNGVKTGVGWFYPAASVLIVLTTMGSGLHALMLMSGRRLSAVLERAGDPARRPRLWPLAKRYADFPVYRAPQAVINAMAHSLPVLMLSALFGAVSAGYFVLCIRILGMSTQLIGTAVGDVFSVHIVEASRQKRPVSRLIVKTTLALALLGMLPFGVVIAGGPWLFGLIFGAEWLMAGHYARWLAVWMFFQFINRPCVAAVAALKIQRGLMIYEIGSTGLKTLGLFIGFFWFGDDVVAVAFFSILGAIAYFFMMTWVIFSARVIDKRQARHAQ